MPVSAEELNEIERVLGAPDAATAAFAALRKLMPHLSCTRCDASDVIETPFRSYPGFDLHLLNSADHCAQITTDPARATGIILARRGGKP